MKMKIYHSIKWFKTIWNSCSGISVSKIGRFCTALLDNFVQQKPFTHHSHDPTPLKESAALLP